MRLLIPLFAALLSAGSAAAQTTRSVALEANDLAYSRLTKRLYASAPATNAIAEIDPLTGDVGPLIFVGSAPRKLALSDDGQFLYVGLDGAAAVARVDLLTRTVDQHFSLGSDSFFGPYFVDDMDVQPAHHDVLAVSLRHASISPRHAGVAVFENGVRRAETTDRHTGSNVIEFADAAGRLYGYNNETTEFGFRRMAVDAAGVTEVDVAASLISGFGTDIEYDAGRIYATTGAIVDAEAKVLVGTIAGIPFGSVVEPDSAAGVVHFLVQDSSTLTLKTFDLSSLVLLRSTPVPDASGTPRSLVRLEGGLLAFATSAGQIFLVGAAALPATHFMAEGATGHFAMELALANPQTLAAPVSIEFLRADGTTRILYDTVPALSQIVLPVDQLRGLNATSLSTVVRSTAGVPLMVGRTMFWDATLRYGGHASHGLPGPRTQWYFAEGAQGFFDTYLLLANPDRVAAAVSVTFLFESEPAITRSYTVPATSRFTIYGGAIPELVGRSFGMVVTADRGIVAERAMYFGTTRAWDGGHASEGAPELATQWFHAEGLTGPFFDAYFLVANPGPDSAEVTFTFHTDRGETITRVLTLAGERRLTVNAEALSPLLASQAFATRVQSTRPIVSERAMYWRGSTWDEGHASVGTTQPGSRWGLADGRVGGAAGFETYVLIGNFASSTASVRATFLRSTGPPVVKTYDVGPTSRFNVHVNSMVPELHDETFGVIVETTNGTDVVVEASTYWNAGAVGWAGGTSVLAVRLP